MKYEFSDDEFEILSDKECTKVAGGAVITPYDYPGKGTFWEGVEMQLDYKNSTEAIWDTVTQKTYA